MPGMLSWDEMNWLFADFAETGLIYHGTRVGKLQAIFRDGLIARGEPDPEDRHDTIYDALVEFRPSHIPEWVDLRHCIFAMLNRLREEARTVTDPVPVSVVLSFAADEAIASRTWVGNTAFSDWLYCPEEAGWLDTPARAAYYRNAIKPNCGRLYWQACLRFEDNLMIRADELLTTREKSELLVCIDRIPPERLSLQALRVKGDEGAATLPRREAPDLFGAAEAALRSGGDAQTELAVIAERCRRG